MRRLAVCAAVATLVAGAGKRPELLGLTGDVEGVHDPAIIKEGASYYVFCTGGRPGAGVIPIRTSKDLRAWTLSGSVFESLPAWATKEIPGARGAWAPDISFFNGRYHLYYAVSTFGSRNSAIGLATNQTLDPARPEYHWVDEGMVLRSFQDKDDWNAIDPNLFVENPRSVWLNWGGFWGGIKMRRLDPRTGKLSTEDTTLYSLASRPRTPPIGGSIEAPFLIRHGGWFYLFVSFDRCCRGVNSTYNVVVGRSRKVTGPYVDKTGKPMTEAAARWLSRPPPRTGAAPAMKPSSRTAVAISWSSTRITAIPAARSCTSPPCCGWTAGLWSDRCRRFVFRQG